MPPITPIRRISSLSNAHLSSPVSNGTTEEPNTTALHESPDIKAVPPSSPAYITLPVSLPSSTFATIVLLGDSFPTSLYVSPSPFPNSQLSTGEKEESPAESPSSNSTVGIVIGCIAAFALLLGVGYVWFLRGKPRKRRKKRGNGKKKRGRKKKTKKKTNGENPGGNKRRRRSMFWRKKKAKKKTNGENPGKNKRRRSVFWRKRRKRRKSKSGSVGVLIYFWNEL